MIFCQFIPCRLAKISTQNQLTNPLALTNYYHCLHTIMEKIKSIMFRRRRHPLEFRIEIIHLLMVKNTHTTYNLMVDFGMRYKI